MKELKTFNLPTEILHSYKSALIKTNKGDIVVELFPKDAPQAVSNFATLANEGFYKNLLFHRVIDSFVAQGGCPLGNGTGGPNYRIKCEVEHNPNKHKRGSLSMAHAGRDTGGSQFFLCFVDLPHLDGEHTVFGAIKDGDEASFAILDSLKKGDTIQDISIKTAQNNN